MRVEAILVGKPKPVTFQGRETTTAIYKAPVKGPVMLRRLNLEGDQQADLRVHGGPDKALYAYGLNAHETWKTVRPQDRFPHGAMGENLTVATLPEDQIYIGSQYRLGEALVQVTQPRLPCYKLGIKFSDPKILKQFMQTGRPGVYFRVLKEGFIEVGQSLELVSQEKTLVSVSELFQLENGAVPDKARLKQMLQVRGLPDSWRVGIQEVVQG